MYVHTYVCVYVCVYENIWIYLYLCVYVRMKSWMHVCLSCGVCVCVCAACARVHMHVHAGVCVNLSNVSIHVCRCVCIFFYAYVCTSACEEVCLVIWGADMCVYVEHMKWVGFSAFLSIRMNDFYISLDIICLNFFWQNCAWGKPQLPHMQLVPSWCLPWGLWIVDNAI